MLTITSGNVRLYPLLYDRRRHERQSPLMRRAMVIFTAVLSLAVAGACDRQSSLDRMPTNDALSSDSPPNVVDAPDASSPESAPGGPRQEAAPTSTARGTVEVVENASEEAERALVPLSTTNNLDQSIRDVIARVDASRDQWPVERINDFVMDCLHQLEDQWRQTTPTRDWTPPWLSQDFRCSPLRPAEFDTVFEGHGLTVQRGLFTNDDRSTLSRTISLAAALHDLRRALDASQDTEVHCKVIRVVDTGDEIATDVKYHAFGKGTRGLREQRATWRLVWSSFEDASQLLLQAIKPLGYEEVIPNTSGHAWFIDRTADVLGSDEMLRKQLAHGVDRWRQDFEASLDPDLTGHQGIAVADFNGDGRDDIYLCQQGGLPNRLLVQQIDGTLADRSSRGGVDFLDLSRSALGIDVDNDGDRDLVVGFVTSLIVMENRGGGVFAERGRYALNATVHSLCAADFDRDGRTDIYACGYSPGTSLWRAGDAFGAPVPYYDANNGGPNVLLRNDGDWQWTDVTTATGMDVNNRRFSFAASWEDFDNDGDVDLYVANDFGRNCLYRNDGGNFEEIAAKAGVEDMATGMSVSWADYNHDGWMDLYVGNMFSSAGNRIAYQRQFLPRAGRTTQVEARRLARGNTLFRGSATGDFADVSEQAGVTMGRWAWGSIFADWNSDGFEDLVVANGFVSHNTTSDL